MLFRSSKNLGALGDGGMITVNDESLCKKIAMLRNYGREIFLQRDSSLTVIIPPSPKAPRFFEG